MTIREYAAKHGFRLRCVAATHWRLREKGYKYSLTNWCGTSWARHGDDVRHLIACHEDFNQRWAARPR